MAGHLSKCAYPDTRNFAAVAQIRVDVPGTPYWLDVDVKENAPLRDLDGFLRVIWLECCDHLSSFDIGRTRYDNVVTDHFLGRERSMDVRLSASLPPAGTEFGYEYDVGSTTRLRLKLVAKRNAPSRR